VVGLSERASIVGMPFVTPVCCRRYAVVGKQLEAGGLIASIVIATLPSANCSAARTSV
jgi:hypothetical protein